MQGRQAEKDTLDMFRSRLESILDPRQELIMLAKSLNWSWIEKELSVYYSDKGRPSIPTRVSVSLLLLKHLYNASDESVVEQWIQNPYWQYFSGMEYMSWEQPCAASDLVHFRHRIGEKGMEKIFEMTVMLHARKLKKEQEVLMDTTVQEKNITFPTDNKMHVKMIETCNRIAKKEGLKLRRSFKFALKKKRLELRLNRLKRTEEQKRKSKKAFRAIKTMARQSVKDLTKKLTAKGLLEKYKERIEIFERVLGQERSDSGKIYSLHEPHVKCICKGKDHKRYEFGNKVGLAVGRKTGIILAVVPGGNEYDGKFVAPLLEQIHKRMGREMKLLIADRGCKGRKKVGQTDVLLPDNLPRNDKTPKERRRLQKAFRDRAGIEPGIGHLKADHRMNRNFLKGMQGDVANAFLACSAFNLKKFLNELFFALFCVCQKTFSFAVRRFFFRFFSLQKSPSSAS